MVRKHKTFLKNKNFLLILNIKIFKYVLINVYKYLASEYLCAPIPTEGRGGRQD